MTCARYQEVGSGMSCGGLRFVGLYEIARTILFLRTKKVYMHIVIDKPFHGILTSSSLQCAMVRAYTDSGVQLFENDSTRLIHPYGWCAVPVISYVMGECVEYVLFFAFSFCKLKC